MTAPIRFKHYTVAVDYLDEAVANHQSRFGMQPVPASARSTASAASTSS